MGSGASVSTAQHAFLARASRVADKALKNRRYLRGMKPEKYFQEVIMRDYGETFDILKITEEEAFELFKHFMVIDNDNSGEVSLEEFHHYLQVKPSKFTERVFTVLDLDMSGMLDFKEFIVGVWNYCTYDNFLAAKFVYDIFDVDGLGALCMAEYDAMLRMLYNTETAEPALLSLLLAQRMAPTHNVTDNATMKEVMPQASPDDNDANTDDVVVAWADFLALTNTNVQILQPAFELQRAMRRRLLGIKYWERQGKDRKELFAQYDSSKLASWEAVEQIIQIKHREREEELKRKKEEVEAHIKMEEEKLQANAAVRHDEEQLRMIKKLQELKDSKLDLEVQEEAAWNALREAREAMNGMFTLSSVEAAVKARMDMWQAFEDATAKSEGAAKAREERALQVAGDEDARHKTDAWIRTKQGRLKYEAMVRIKYMGLVHEALLQGGTLQRAMAPLYDTEGGEVGLAADMSYRKNPRKKELAEAWEAVRDVIVQKYAQQELTLVKERHVKQAQQRALDFSNLKLELEERYRPKPSLWVELWDEDDEENFLYNSESEERQPGGTSAICEQCDHCIPPGDFKCFDCGTDRSAKNKLIYDKFKAQQ